MRKSFRKSRTFQPKYHLFAVWSFSGIMDTSGALEGIIPQCIANGKAPSVLRVPALAGWPAFGLSEHKVV